MSAAVVTRADLGLPASPASSRPLGEVGGVTVHHTTGATLAQQATQERPDVLAWVRNLWSFHTDERLPAHAGLPATKPWSGARGWADLGYHRLYHLPLRLTFEGRPLGRVGAHAAGPANRSRIGVVVLGGGILPTHGDVVWLADQIDKLRAEVGYPARWTIDGHRDHGSTTCPGGGLYAALPRLREPGAAPLPPPTKAAPVTEEQAQRIVALLGEVAATNRKLVRLAAADTTRTIAALRDAAGLPPEPASDEVWPPRIAAGTHSVADAIAELAAKVTVPRTPPA